jgi:hypothetical protein
MIANATLGRVAPVVAVVGLIVGVAGTKAAAGEPMARCGADGHGPLKGLPGGVEPFNSANVHHLKWIGDCLLRLVPIGRFRQWLGKAKAAGDNDAADPTLQARDVGGAGGQSAARTPAPSSQLVWPEILYREYYVQHRVEIDRLIAERAVTGANAGNRDAIQQAVAQMKSRLKEQIKATSPMEYLSAKRFLDQLVFEARFVASPSTGLVASK